MLVPTRNYQSPAYRYGFQGQEKDDEIKGEGNSINYKFRMHDPRVGRFFAVDPLIGKYPYYSPYSFGGNRVIDGIELEGLEYTPYKSKNKTDKPVFIEGGGSILNRVNNAADNLMGFIVNNTYIFAYNTSSDAINFSGKLITGEYNEVTLPELLDKGMRTTSRAIDGTVEYHSETPIKQQLTDAGESLTTLDNYSEAFQLLLAKKVSLNTKSLSPKGKAQGLAATTEKTVSKLSKRIQALPKALQQRPKWRKSTRDYLNKNSRKRNGNFVDVKTGLEINGKKHIGHQNVSWREYQDNPANRSKTRAEVIDDYNNVDNLGYESGPSNSANGAKTKGLENK